MLRQQIQQLLLENKHLDDSELIKKLQALISENTSVNKPFLLSYSVKEIPNCNFQMLVYASSVNDAQISLQQFIESKELHIEECSSLTLT